MKRPLRILLTSLALVAVVATSSSSRLAAQVAAGQGIMGWGDALSIPACDEVREFVDRSPDYSVASIKEVELTSLVERVKALSSASGPVAPPNPAALPDLPDPPPGRWQSNLVASNTYIVWVSQSLDPYAREQSDILGWDIQAGAPITVTDAPGEQNYPAIAGSVVVWLDSGAPGVAGKDLATGKTFTVPVHQDHWYGVALHGRTVAWVGSSGSTSYILTYDIDTGRVDEFAALPPGGYDGGTLEMSGEYIAWTYHAFGWETCSLLLAFDRATKHGYLLGQMPGKTPGDGGVFPGWRIALNGPMLLTESLIDLRSMEQAPIPIPVSGSLFTGKQIVWIDYGGDLVGYIWGIEFGTTSDYRVPTLLVSEPGNYNDVAVAGDWLVYTVESERRKGDWRLEAIPLADAFQQLPEKTIDAQWTLLLQKQKPLDLATLRADHLQGTAITPYGPASIAQRVLVLGLGDSRVVDLSRAAYEDGWYSLPVTWRSDNYFAGPVIVRGRQLDGDGEVRFGTGPDPDAQLLLAVGETFRPMSHTVPDGWQSALRVKGPGQYALQIDGQSESTVIKFDVVRALPTASP